MNWTALKPLAKRILPAPVRRFLRVSKVRYSETPPFKCVQFGDLRRVSPIHFGFGVGRGTYIDRYYIEGFLHRHSGCIRGRVLEFAENEYTLKFGGDKVTQSDIIDVRSDYPSATIVADLADGRNIPSDAFDCVILTQTLNCIYDVHGAVRTVFRILKPGGSVLVTVPGISQIVPDEMEYCGDYWRFTRLSIRRLFEEAFPAENVFVEPRGNVLASVAFLHGLAVEELRREELEAQDPNFELAILLKAVKPQ